MIAENGLPGGTGPTRRRFLAGAGAVTALPSILGHANAAPRTYQARIFPISQPVISGPYPEQTIPRYSAAMGKWGVSFSGGGPRSFSATLGQMRGLHASGVIDDIGAFSFVSGATWFGGTFMFAPTSFADATLLGRVVMPADLTVEKLNNIPTYCLGARIPELHDLYLLLLLALEISNYENKLIPIDKLYSRVLNDAFLAPYGLAGTSTPFTLNPASLAAIEARNSALRTPFLLPRPGRPFFIASGTQIFQVGVSETASGQKKAPVQQVFQPVEYTPLYSGAPRRHFQGHGQPPYGGGFVESFAFGTPTPTSVAGDIVTVAPPKYPFLLSDVLGSSSASIGAAVANYLKPLPQLYPFPQFSYWPVDRTIATTPATTYDFADGGVLEDTGIIPLLSRGYKTIFAFVNSKYPIGSTMDECVDGIDGQITRLFGRIPRGNLGNTQDTRVFEFGKFKELANGLKAAKAAGGAVVYAGQFRVVPDNPFGIAPYTPRIFWIYNDINLAWRNKLPSPVQAVFDNPKYNLSDFPNYATTNQNKDEVLYLTKPQVNLLADMWSYTVVEGFKDAGTAFGYPIH